MRRKTLKNQSFLFALALFSCFYSFLWAKSDKSALNRTPKNIIIMISDGCGYNHVDAASLYQYGQTGIQPYERFPIKCGMTTYPATRSYDPFKAWTDFNNVKTNWTDSAAAGTAISCGVKTYNGAIGLGPDKKPLGHMIDHCEDLGKSTGLVTSVQISHATPAAFAAHSKERKYYEKIAKQMIFESSVDVIMGCGHPLYDEDGKKRKKVSGKDYDYIGGKSTFKALKAGTAGGDADSDGINDPWKLIETRDEFQKLSSGETPKRLLGLVQIKETLQQKRSGDDKAAPYIVPLIKTVPTLVEMTNGALNILDNDKDGFFLMIEGGAVDWAGHDNQSGRMIEEQIDFNKTVEAVIKWIENNGSWDETLLIVTSDHECGYLTGPNSGQKTTGPVWNPLKNNGKNNMPGIEWHSDEHTNSLVPFYAKGQGARLFKEFMTKHDIIKGPYIDNTDIAKVIFRLLAE